MESSESFLRDFSQHDRLPIRLFAPGFGHSSPGATTPYGSTYRLAYYFFLFVWEGATEFGLDLDRLRVEQHELVFALPHQVRHLPAVSAENAYYKLGLHEECLSRLPRHYPFLLNPLNQPKIRFPPPAAARVKTIFDLLTGLLGRPDTATDLLLAQLNSLLTEINVAYFAAAENPADERLTKYLQFSLFVENNLTEQPAIGRIAEALALSTDSLYQLVKHYAGLSPKEFLTSRLILEAKRRLYYGDQASVKELAFELGFNDPAYFSRLFKKATGKTVAAYARDLS